MKLTAKKLKELIKEAAEQKKRNSMILAKPAAEYEMAKRVFEQESRKSVPDEKLQKAAFNSMMAASVFADGSLEEDAKASYELDVHTPSSPNPEVVERFFVSLYAGKRSGFLTYYQKEELADMHLYIIKGHNAGYALKGGNDIVSVHNNSEIKGLGKFFMESAKANGGTMLDHFDGFLSGLYRRNGFTDVYEVYQWDEQYRPSAWTYDSVDVFNENTSIYSQAMNALKQDSENPQGSLPNQDMEILAENNFKITINPNLKYNQYLYGRPDVIMRRM